MTDGPSSPTPNSSEEVPEPREGTQSTYPPTPGEENSDNSPDLPGTGGTGKFLWGLLNRSFILDLHVKAGDPSKHPYRAGFAFLVDVILRLIIIAILLGLVLAVAYKTLAPLPHPTMDDYIFGNGS